MMRAALVAAASLFVAVAPAANRSLEIVDREVYLMGTRARLETYAPTRQEGIAALDRALAVLEATEDELSTWREHSAISELNRQAVGRPWQASKALCATFAELFRLARLTRGAFDPAIGALTDAWGIHDGGRIPSSVALRAARGASGMRLLAFDDEACTVTRRANATVDVGAWGKGEAIDRVRRALHDVPWLIDLGGQIGVNGRPPAAASWAASVAHPQRRNDAVIDVALRGGSLSTSAGSERDLVVDGRRVAHHLDPRTGQPVAFSGSVSVWHASALVADALSTALYVMGPTEGLRWAEQHDIAACYLIPHDGGVVARMTSTFRRIVMRPQDY